MWALDTGTQILRVIYDGATAPTPVLGGVDGQAFGVTYEVRGPFQQLLA